MLVTPNYLGARDSAGKRCIERADDPVRDELAAGARRQRPRHSADVRRRHRDARRPPTLPAPFDQLVRAHLAAPARLRLARGPGAPERRPARARPRAAHDAGAARLARRCRSWALEDVGERGRGSTTAATRSPRSARDRPRRRRRGLALAREEGGEPRRPLARQHRQEAARSTSRDGEIVNVTIEQNGASLRVASSAVDIEQDPDWQKYRAFWQESFGQPLNSVFYRGEGVAAERRAATAPDAPPGPRRVLLSVHVDPPEGGEPIDTGALRGTIDPDGNRIRARLWLNSEQGERVVDLRREP